MMPSRAPLLMNCVTRNSNMRANAVQYTTALREASSSVAVFRKRLEVCAVIHAAFMADEKLHAAFLGAQASPAAQRNAIDRALGKELDDGLRSFFGILAEHRVMPLIPEIVRAGLLHADREEGIARVHVTSARELSATLRTRIESTLETELQRKVRATYEERPECIAGFRCEVDAERAWDGTVLGKLERLQERIRMVTAPGTTSS